MNYKLLALGVLTISCINAYDAPCDGVFFAPYDGLYPVSIETRFDGIVENHHDCFDTVKDIFAYKFNGYIKFGRGFFFKQGVEIVGTKVGSIDWHDRCIFERVGIDLQFGKYWDGIGAVRVGMFSDGPGIGGDYWLIYKNRFKWLTTLEFSGSKVNRFFGDHGRFRPLITWLNRFFVWENLYISGGFHLLGDSKMFKQAINQGFIGFGVSI